MSDSRLPTDSFPAAELQLQVDGLPAMLAYWDANQRCRFANRAYEKWFGVAPRTMLGRDMQEFLGPLYALNRAYIEGALAGVPQEFERDIPDPLGGPVRHSLVQYIPDVVDGEVRGFCVLIADISRLKVAEASLIRMERQLHASERLGALSTLASGIGLAINNPLTAVIANLQLAMESLKGAPVEASKTLLAEAAAGAMRVREIVQSMRLLARGDAANPERVDVNDTVERSIDLVSASNRYRATIKRELADVGCVAGSASQLAQVLVNLLTNAVQALGAEPAPFDQILVSTSREGGVVTIAVADTGHGIPPEVQARIFEPFFTTRPVGSGIGLGLSISAAIVKGHGGELAMTSGASGTTFRVTIPAGPAEKLDECALAEPRSPASACSEKRKRVLVIDDEPSVAKVVKRILSRSCEVVVEVHPRVARDMLLGVSGSSFDVILCDLAMPELGGDALFRDVTEAHPALAERFVFMTGGAFGAEGHRFLSHTRATVIEKPFDIARLRAIVEPAPDGQ